MRVVRLVPVFLFFLLLGGQVLLSDEAYAACCGCSTCTKMWGCSCPGQNGCVWYPCAGAILDDPATLQPKTPAVDATLDIRGVREPRPFTLTNPDVTERLLTLMRGSRVRGHFTLKLLGNGADGLKFACPSF